MLTAAWIALTAGPAAAQVPLQVVGPYDGQIPFRCQLQNVGTGTAFPDPGADPFCVEFDKTNQNLTGFGIVEFTAQEPARVAAAASKCFYFQRDHWTGSVSQGQAPELWHWDGDYWFDRARGLGGVSVRNFRIGGQPQSAAPYVPAAYQPYFDEDGGGGVEVVLASNPDPVCAARVDTPEERDEIYADRGLSPDCIEPGGKLRGRRVGGVKLGMSRSRVLGRLGPPRNYARRIDRWCLVGKGELRVAYGVPAKARARARAILTSGRGQSLRGVARGDRARRARRLLDLRPRGRARGTRVFAVRRVGARKVRVGIAGGRVRWLVIARPHTRLTRSLLTRLAP